jgi:serine/threonine protein kinase
VNRKSDKEPYSPRHADIWALGVILINLLVSRHPWETASRRDPSFSDYMTDDEFFLDMFPISKSANYLLCRMMRLEPSSRIGIGALKMAIEDMDTFFMTDEELHGPLGTSSNRRVAREFNVNLRPHNSPPPFPRKQIASIILPGEEVDITSILLSTSIYDSDPDEDYGYSSYLEDSFVQRLDYFKPSTPHEAHVARPWRHNQDIAILRYMLANTPIKLNIEDVMRADKLNLDVETSEEARNAQRSGLPITQPCNERVPSKESEFVIGSLSSGANSCGPVTPQTLAIDIDSIGGIGVSQRHFPALRNPYSSYEDRDMMEVDLGVEEVDTEEGSFDVGRILDTPATEDNPLYVVQPPQADSRPHVVKRKWFVKDFRKLRQLA